MHSGEAKIVNLVRKHLKKKKKNQNKNERVGARRKKGK
jgi:hypothetical protein